MGMYPKLLPQISQIDADYFCAHLRNLWQKKIQNAYRFTTR